jgi:hypothetical protein
VNNLGIFSFEQVWLTIGVEIEYLKGGKVLDLMGNELEDGEAVPVYFES